MLLLALGCSVVSFIFLVLSVATGWSTALFGIAACVAAGLGFVFLSLDSWKKRRANR